MYLSKITLRNIKCFANFELDFSEGSDIRLWTALIGENGLGKSTLLQAIGVALAGPSGVRELLPRAEGWVRQGHLFGEIVAELRWTEGDALVTGWPKKASPYIARYIVTGDNPEQLPDQVTERSPAIVVDWSGSKETLPKEREYIAKDMSRLKQTAYAEGKPGWLGCGYGPFRRLSGGSQDADRILYAERKSARWVTLFREDAALTNATQWLITLYNIARDGDVSSQRALERVKVAFANDLLPHPAKLDVNARAALLQIGSQIVPFQDLSDGYRSMLALGIDLLRWLTVAFPEEDNPMNCPGVVLIDELDAHLHPSWQQQIGLWLRRKFPKIQFIIATHSPFLAQVADPRGNIVLESTPNGVRPRPEVEPVESWHAEQILRELFDLPSTRSPKVECKLQRQQALYQESLTRGLSQDERKEYEQLGLWRENLTPPLEDAGQRRLAQSLKTAVEQIGDHLQEIS